jgi:acetyltransferase-like isoleucine patch superfamily enzyme
MALEQHVLIRKYGKYEKLFSWLRFFYPDAKGISYLFLLYYLVPQKVFRVNGRVPWPVHFTSRVLYHKRIHVGNRSAPGINANCYVQGRCGITIGHNFRMGPGSGLISANHVLSDYDTWEQTNPLTIGDNVWIGMNTVVLPGITIGSNVVIGANSVVDKTIPDNSLVLGNPCKVIKEKPPYTGFDYSKL